MNSFLKLLGVLFFTLGLVNIGFCKAAKLDTSGLGKKLDYCYELRKTRDDRLLPEAKKLLPFAYDNPKFDIEIKIYTLLVKAFLTERMHDSALFYISKCSLPLRNNISNKSKFDFYILKARLDLLYNSFNSAIDNALNALSIGKSVQDKTQMAIALTTLANINSSIGRVDQSLAYLEESSTYSLEASDSITYAYTIQAIAAIYFKKRDYSKAATFYKKSADIFLKSGNKVELRHIYSILADCYYHFNNYGQALKYIEICESLRKNKEIDYFKTYNYAVMARSYYKLEDQRKAMMYADSLKDNLNTIAAKELRMYFLGACIEIYSGTKNYDKAIGLINTYDSLSNTITDSLKNAYAVDKEFDFRFSNVKAELKRIKAEKEVQEELNALQQRILLFGTAAFILLIVALAIGIFSYRRKIYDAKLLNQKNKQIEEQLQIMQSQNELQLLTIGVVGHDLRGPLSSSLGIKYILDKYFEQGRLDEFKKVLGVHFESLERMHNLAQNLVSWVLSAKSGLSLNFEIVSILKVVNQISFNLHDLITEKGIVFENKVPSTAIAFVDAPSTETILRNVIQNAIKFTEAGKRISVSAELNESAKEIIITVSDEGKGMPADVLEKVKAGNTTFSLGTKGEKGNGLGLIMIQTLLTLNKGKMKISSEEGVGTSFSVILPTRA